HQGRAAERQVVVAADLEQRNQHQWRTAIPHRPASHWRHEGSEPYGWSAPLHYSTQGVGRLRVCLAPRRWRTGVHVRLGPHTGEDLLALGRYVAVCIAFGLRIEKLARHGREAQEVRCVGDEGGISGPQVIAVRLEALEHGHVCLFL